MEELGALDVSLPEYPLHPQTGTSHGGIRGFRCKLTRIPPPKLELLMDGVGGGFRSELIQNPPPHLHRNLELLMEIYIIFGNCGDSKTCCLWNGYNVCLMVTAHTKGG